MTAQPTQHENVASHGVTFPFVEGVIRDRIWTVLRVDQHRKVRLPDSDATVFTSKLMVSIQLPGTKRILGLKCRQDEGLPKADGHLSKLLDRNGINPHAGTIKRSGDNRRDAA